MSYKGPLTDCPRTFFTLLLERQWPKNIDMLSACPRPYVLWRQSVAA
jgi:hypothetical protein